MIINYIKIIVAFPVDSQHYSQYFDWQVDYKFNFIIIGSQHINFLNLGMKRGCVAIFRIMFQQ